MKFFGENGFYGRPEMKKNVIGMLEDKPSEKSSGKEFRMNPKELPMIRGISTIAGNDIE